MIETSEIPLELVFRKFKEIYKDEARLNSTQFEIFRKGVEYGSEIGQRVGTLKEILNIESENKDNL